MDVGFIYNARRTSEELISRVFLSIQSILSILGLRRTFGNKITRISFFFSKGNLTQRKALKQINSTSRFWREFLIFVGVNGNVKGPSIRF